MDLPWQRFIRGETAVDFGMRYLCASAAGDKMGVYWSHQLPRGTDWVLSLEWLRSTLPPTTGES